VDEGKVNELKFIHHDKQSFSGIKLDQELIPSNSLSEQSNNFRNTMRIPNKTFYTIDAINHPLKNNLLQNIRTEYYADNLSRIHSSLLISNIYSLDC